MSDRDEPEPVKSRSQRDYLAILAGPLTAAIATLAVALIGYFTTEALTQSQAAADKRAMDEQKAAAERSFQEQNFRFYAEMVNQREQVESELRRDVLARVLGEFFEQSEAGDPVESLNARLLKLELMALNFGESLSLSPLFVELADDIAASDWDSFGSLQKDRLNARLRGLARRVTDRQLAALSAGGEAFNFEIKVFDINGQAKFVWPDDDVNDPSGQLSVENVERAYKIGVSRADLKRRTVAVELKVIDVTDSSAPATEMTFTLDQFNFPMVDNTRLSQDQRFALVMTSFDDKTVKFTGICFPGLYATQREKPFLDEIIKRLGQLAESSAGSNGVAGGTDK